MKRTLLNCDQVFDVLTRGPFPTGEPEDVAVEQHLRACHDCRQLAEALRPAISLLHEAVADDEAIDLPEYQGSLPWKRPRKRRLSISRLAAPPANGEPVVTPPPVATSGQPRPRQFISSARFIAAGLLIAALGLLVGGTMVPSQRQPASHLAAVPAKIDSELYSPPTEAGLLTLAALKLPTTCLPLTHRPMSKEQAAEIAASLADGSTAPLRCCTECHHAGSNKAKVEKLVAVVQKNCQVCHHG